MGGWDTCRWDWWGSGALSGLGHGKRNIAVILAASAGGRAQCVKVLPIILSVLAGGGDTKADESLKKTETTKEPQESIKVGGAETAGDGGGLGNGS